jgi:hypothetical protein
MSRAIENRPPSRRYAWAWGAGVLLLILSVVSDPVDLLIFSALTIMVLGLTALLAYFLLAAVMRGISLVGKHAIEVAPGRHTVATSFGPISRRALSE